MKRALPLVVAAATLLSVPAHAAAPPFKLRGLDVSAYPTIRLVVHSAKPGTAPRVFENGIRVAGVSATNLGASKAVVLAIDRSQSMTGTPLEQAAAAAKELVQRKRPRDRIEVVTFGSTALAATPFSQSARDSDGALSSLAPDPTTGTALFDAVVLSASDLRHQQLAGRVLVLLTDGRDLGSSSTLRSAERAAQKAGMVVYTVALGHSLQTPLKQLASATGGLFYSSPTPAALSAVYQRVGSELDHTWRVSYTTSAFPGDRITVSVGSGPGSSATAELPGRLAYHPLVPRFLLNSAPGVLLLTLVIAGLIFFGITRLATVPQNQRIRQRVLDHTEGRNIRRSERRQRRTLAELAAAVNQRLRGIPQLQRVDRLLEAAGIPASSGAVLVGSALLALVLALFAAVTTGSGTFVFIFFVLGLAGPVFLLRRLGRRRVGAIERQLPDVLATIASSLRVGHGLKQALQTVASEGSPPVSVELRRVLSEARLGRPLEEALVAMCERLGSEDLLYIATAVDVQTQVGGSLSGVFETVSVTVRERQQHRRRVRSITSTGRATATVMSLMPLGFLLLLLVVAPGYVTPFLSSHLGHVLMLASMVSIGIGAFLLSRIVSVKS